MHNARVGAVTANAAPQSGSTTVERLDDGIVGIEPLVLASCLRAAFKARILVSDGPHVSITDSGWKVLEENQEPALAFLKEWKKQLKLEVATGFGE